MKSIASLFLFLTMPYFLIAGEIEVKKIEPPNWWIGMKMNKIQLMIYGKNLKDASVESENPAILVENIRSVENQDYLFVTVEVAENAEPGSYTLAVKNNESSCEFDYELLERENSSERYQGFSDKDIIYLITPDRFANGDEDNDVFEGMINDFNPKIPLFRHGGDIQGIINKLDYLADLGITTIWSNPLVENNTNISYHGYAATDLYNIDKRYGSNKLYRELVEDAHAKGLKIIFDHVSNHISIDHPWMSDLPTHDWIHGSQEHHLNAEHDKMVLSDIHADPVTFTHVQEGWFVDTMPDLDQQNVLVKNYLIQNTIWWIEYSGIDGIREDTYPYADQKFLADWAAAIFNEYPGFNIVGEVWTGQTSFLAYYQKGSYLPREFDSNLPCVTDFALRDAFYNYLHGTADLYEIYQTISKDNLYPDSDNLVTFIDNHDVVRAAFAADSNLSKVKRALTILLTTRGIPQILYGTEIGMIGGEAHEFIRSDFPGGFPGDKRDAFTKEGRIDSENDFFNFTRELFRLRKESKALQSGKLIQMPPKDDVYTFFRINDEERFVIAINDGIAEKTIDTNLIEDVVGKFTDAEFIFGSNLPNVEQDKIIVPGQSAAIYKLR